MRCLEEVGELGVSWSLYLNRFQVFVLSDLKCRRAIRSSANAQLKQLFV